MRKRKKKTKNSERKTLFIFLIENSKLHHKRTRERERDEDDSWWILLSNFLSATTFFHKFRNNLYSSIDREVKCVWIYVQHTIGWIEVRFPNTQKRNNSIADSYVPLRIEYMKETVMNSPNCVYSHVPKGIPGDCQHSMCDDLWCQLLSLWFYLRLHSHHLMMKYFPAAQWAAAAHANNRHLPSQRRDR